VFETRVVGLGVRVTVTDARDFAELAREDGHP
jgi:hypothetical protein